MKSIATSTLLLLCLSSCEDRNPAPEFQLPPATQTGANTMGFRVDGRTWQNHGRSCTMYGCHDNKLTAYVEVKRNGVVKFDLSAGLNAKDMNESFGLLIDSLRGPGTYLSRPWPDAQRGLREQNSLFFSNGKQRVDYASFKPDVSRIIITKFDTASRIISGEFEGRLRGIQDTTAFVHIREGRFDVVYEQ